MQNLDYDKMVSINARHRIVNKSVLDELRRKWVSSSESRILEVGCGTGIHLRTPVEATGCKGWGIDPSREMISHAATDERLHFLQGFEHCGVEQEALYILALIGSLVAFCLLG